MSDYKQQREERRRMKEEWRARLRERYPHMMRSHDPNGGIWTGVFVLLIGVAALVKVTVAGLPEWLFSWQSFLIVMSIFFGFRVYSRGGSLFAPFVMFLVGVAFLIPEINPELSVRPYVWPVILILVGLFFIVRSRSFGRKGNSEKKNNFNADIEDATIVDETEHSKEDFIQATSVFGGTKKNILSKNFKGGNIVNVFGGTEIYLGQADIRGRAVIDTATIFGGLTLIIPSNWTVKSEAAIVFGGIEDKRSVTPVTDGTEKILVIKGTVLFGGIDIKSY